MKVPSPSNLGLVVSNFTSRRHVLYLKAEEAKGVKAVNLDDPV